MSRSTIGLKLDDDTRQRLQDLGRHRDRSPHWLMKAAIREYLDRKEHRERERHEDEERWQRYLAGGAHIDHPGMMAWLDDLAEQADRLAGRHITDDAAAGAADTRMANGHGEARPSS